MRPGRSVTSMRPSPTKATAQGFCRPLATTSVATRVGCASAVPQASAPTSAAAKARAKGLRGCWVAAAGGLGMGVSVWVNQ